MCPWGFCLDLEFSKSPLVFLAIPLVPNNYITHQQGTTITVSSRCWCCIDSHVSRQKKRHSSVLLGVIEWLLYISQHPSPGCRAIDLEWSARTHTCSYVYTQSYTYTRKHAHSDSHTNHSYSHAHITFWVFPFHQWRPARPVFL